MRSKTYCVVSRVPGVGGGAGKQRRGRRQFRDLSLAEAWDRCPYRSLLGAGTDPEEMARRMGCAVVVIGGEKPEPLSQRMLMDAVAVLRAGRVVLLLADDKAQRDYAKREILAMAGPAGGAA